MEKEIWKDIEGYEGLYQISNLGRIKAIGHNAYKYSNVEYIMKQTLNCGYYNISLRKNTIKKTYRVHRLLAKTFIPNPENKKFINHIDGNKLNNDLSNLEWCTPKENIVHAYTNGLCSNNSPIIQLVEIKRYNSLLEAERETGVSHTTISRAIRKNNRGGGYYWLLNKK